MQINAEEFSWNDSREFSRNPRILLKQFELFAVNLVQVVCMKERLQIVSNMHIHYMFSVNVLNAKFKTCFQSSIPVAIATIQITIFS